MNRLIWFGRSGSPRSLSSGLGPAPSGARVAHHSIFIEPSTRALARPLDFRYATHIQPSTWRGGAGTSERLGRSSPSVSDRVARVEWVGLSPLNAPAQATLAGVADWWASSPEASSSSSSARARVCFAIPGRAGASPGAFPGRRCPPGRFPLNASHFTAPGVPTCGRPSGSGFPRLSLDREPPPWPFPVLHRLPPSKIGRAHV